MSAPHLSVVDALRDATKHHLPDISPALLDRINHQTYLTTDEAAIYVRCETRAAFYEWIHEYRVPKCKRGRLNLFLRRDLDEAVGNVHRHTVNRDS